MARCFALAAALFLLGAAPAPSSVQLKYLGTAPR